MFLVDQPGIGGLKITEAAYLEKFGPGHFNWTFMLGEKGTLLRNLSYAVHDPKCFCLKIYVTFWESVTL